jgi:GT2 family glycosyltransferase
MSQARVLLVVPTLGQRITYLYDTLSSIAAQDLPTDVVLVAPLTPEIQGLAEQFNAQVLPDPGSQPKAINAGMRLAQPNHEYVNWLGDDDLLEPGSLACTTRALDTNPEAVVAYGACRYINESNQELWVSKAGPWATRILAWGPDLIPQPGMLVRRSAWERVGGVDESYRFAFDLDLLLRLKTVGALIDVGQVVSSFRWHAESLTVSDRATNLAESERAKRTALSPRARQFAWLWEAPVRIATRVAAREVNRRATRHKAST